MIRLALLWIGIACHAAAQGTAEFPLESGRVTLSVKVNGQGPFPFGLDTGASGVGWVHKALAARLRLPAAGGFRVSDGATSTAAGGAKIDSLALGPVSVQGAEIPVLDSGQCDVGAEVVCGTLGVEAFAGNTFTLDYPGKKLIVSKAPLPTASDVVAYMPSHGTPRADILIAGTTFRAWIDSGSRGSLLLPLALAKKLPLAGELSPAGKVATVVTQYDLYKAQLAGSVKLGAVSIDKPEVFFTDMVKEPTLGRGILQTLVTTFDTVNHRVRFARTTEH